MLFGLEQCGRQVAFSGVWENDDDCLAVVFVERGESEGYGYCCTAADTANETFFFGKSTRHIEGFFVGDLFDFVDDAHVHYVGDESGADALNFVGAGISAGENGGKIGRASCRERV